MGGFLLKEAARVGENPTADDDSPDRPEPDGVRYHLVRRETGFPWRLRKIISIHYSTGHGGPFRCGSVRTPALPGCYP